MNLYSQILIIIVVTYFLFYFKRNASRIDVSHISPVSVTTTTTTDSTTKPKIVEHLTPPFYMNYKSNNYDLNDLNLEHSKRYYPLNFDGETSMKQQKYIKAINENLSQIRQLVNKNKELLYNVNNLKVNSIISTPEPFLFIAKYLVDKLNFLGNSQFYKVTFIEFKKIIGEETKAQFKVTLDMRFNLLLKKESPEDTEDSHKIVIKSTVVINKPATIRFKQNPEIFFRTLFIDDKFANDFMPKNYYARWVNPDYN
jgi:hypothetical protein